MKRILLSLFLTLLVAGTTVVRAQHWISDAETLRQVKKDFEAKKAALPVGDLFAVFNTPDLTEAEREALEFLYAYMPVADITNNSGTFYLDNVRSALKTQRETAWGKTIPELIFRHFVMPIRVNNEDLDRARMVFAPELKDVVRGKSMYDAVLAVNHWCHAHAVYTPSDMRTISPLNICKTAAGRCGEESTFAVTALRAAGIPARQIYTPRWAHTNSNHAWVEAWVDGKWMFFGACEPEPVLNMGWFNGPAYRAMLLHTRVFGKYNGPEEVMARTATFTEINVLPDYAPTARGSVIVKDGAGQAVEGATVEFMIFNSMNFSPVLSEKTDRHGSVTLTAGKGDLFIWVHKGDKVGYGKLSFGKQPQITITLDKTAAQLTGADLDIIPPVEGSVPVGREVTDAMRAANDKQSQEDDRIRNAFEKTFLSEETAQAEAEKLKLEGKPLCEYLVASRGNWREIIKFLENTSPANRATAVTLLGTISRKDLQDTEAEVLKAHLDETLALNPDMNSPLFVPYVLNPRVSSEKLSIYRNIIREAFPKTFIAEVQNNPSQIVEWCRKELKIIDEQNPQRIMAAPAGVLKARVCETGSRDIFFIAFCRSLGIPARIDPVARRVQYFDDNAWHNVDFDEQKEQIFPQGTVSAIYTPTPDLPDPAFFTHFSLSYITADGQLQSRYLFRPRPDGATPAGGRRGGRGTWSSLLKEPLPVDAGSYMLLSGTRLDDGSVLAHIEFFTVEEGKNTQTQVIVREAPKKVTTLGKINADAVYQPADGGKPLAIKSAAVKPYYIIGILGARQEPTNHAMNDISHVSAQFEQWGGALLLLFPDRNGYKKFRPDEFPGLPKNIRYGIDSDKLATTIATTLKMPDAATLPIFVIVDESGQIVFSSQGYTIGIGEQMLKIIKTLTKK